MSFGASRRIPYREELEPRPVTSRTRTGRAFLIDTFEYYQAYATEKWIQAYGTIALATDYPKGGKYCMKLTTLAEVYSDAMAQLYLGAFPKGRFGVEFEFQSGSGASNLRHLDIAILYYDGAYVTYGQLRWSGQTNRKWTYRRESDGFFVDLPNGSQDLYVESANQPLWHNIKVVMDILREKYVKLACDEKVWGMSALGLFKLTSTDAPRLQVGIAIENAVNGASRIARIDNVILTDMEP